MYPLISRRLSHLSTHRAVRGGGILLPSSAAASASALHHHHQQQQQQKIHRQQQQQQPQSSSSTCSFSSWILADNSSSNTSSSSNRSRIRWLRPHPPPYRHLPQQQQQRRTVFIQTENTPNPESIKFLPTNTVVLEAPDEGGGGATGIFITRNDPQDTILKSPLATSLFKMDDVKAVFFGADFVTVTKFATGKWQYMRPEIFSILMDFFENPSNKVVLDQPVITDTTILDDDDEIVAMIKELIEDRIRPAVMEDGGDIRYVNFDETDGMVTVQLAGSCVGCPSSSVTLKQGVENMLMHYIPEVTAVQALEEEDDGDDERNNIVIDKSTDGNNDDAEDENSTATKQQKTYEERLAAAGIPFSD